MIGYAQHGRFTMTYVQQFFLPAILTLKTVMLVYGPEHLLN